MDRRRFLKSAALTGVAGALAGAGAFTGASVLHAADRTLDTKGIRSFNQDMRYRTFGKTGEKVSVLGFGCMRLPVIDNDITKTNMPEAMKLMESAISGGLNYFDTSWPYHSSNPNIGGSSEPSVG